MPSVISGDANVSASEFGFLDGVTSALQTQINSKLNLAGGKILQIVRATDSTNRSTTSTSYVDVTGMSVTITPQKSDSAIILIATGFVRVGWTTTGRQDGSIVITDSSNNQISGTQQAQFGFDGAFTTASNFDSYLSLIGYATPATTSATTYKLRFLSRAAATTISLLNGNTTGQMYAIEVSA